MSKKNVLTLLLVCLVISSFIGSLTYFYHKGVFVGRLESYLYTAKNYEVEDIESIKIDYAKFGFQGIVVFKDEKDAGYYYLFNQDDKEVYQSSVSHKNESKIKGKHLEEVNE